MVFGLPRPAAGEERHEYGSMTHLKIVAVSLICATIVAGIGIVARVTDGTMTSKGLADARTRVSSIAGGALSRDFAAERVRTEKIPF